MRKVDANTFHEVLQLSHVFACLQKLGHKHEQRTFLVFSVVDPNSRIDVDEEVRTHDFNCLLEALKSNKTTFKYHERLRIREATVFVLVLGVVCHIERSPSYYEAQSMKS